MFRAELESFVGETHGVSTRPTTAAGTAPTAGPTVAVVLAAGAGRRFAGRGHKLTADLDGTAVGTRAVDAARRARIGAVVVVTGAATPELPGVEPGDHLVVAHNPAWDDGQISSVHVGLRAAAELGAEAVVVGLADQPFVTPDAWRAVAASSSPIAVATYDGRRGNPVRLHRSVWSLLPQTGDEGARALMRLRPDLVEPIPCPGSPADIDTLEDLQRWQNNS